MPYRRIVFNFQVKLITYCIHFFYSNLIRLSLVTRWKCNSYTRRSRRGRIWMWTSSNACILMHIRCRWCCNVIY